MFKILGVSVLLHAVFAALKGEVHAKSGAWGRTVSRTSSPEYFGAVIAIYACLGVALIAIF